jgi:hypothetical protein
MPSWIASMISWAGMPLPGISRFVAAPHLGDRGAVLGVGDVAVAGQLVALVAVLAPALAVALPGDGGHPAAGLAELAGGEPEVDGGEHVVDALGLLLDAAGVQHHAGGRGPPQLGASSMRAAGTPQISAAHAGVMSATAAAARVEVDGVLRR